MSVISLRVSPDKKNFIEDILNSEMESKGLNKQDAVYSIFSEYRRLNNELKSTKQNEQFEMPIHCEFLTNENNTFLCLENMRTTKRPIELGVLSNDVKIKCNACITGKQIKQQEDIQKIMQRENTRKLIQFIKEFMIISQQGFDVGITVCKGALVNNTMIMSRDGETLYCPEKDNELVNIKKVCLERINYDSTTPCNNLVKIDHHVDFSDAKEYNEVMNKIKPILKIEDKTGEKE